MNIDKYEINKEYVDEFGRISGVFAVDKPIGKTSHDIVYDYKRKYNTREVGHAGALDPFATGVLIILVGKATKLSDRFLHFDKAYEAEILFGLTTDSLDPEGRLLSFDPFSIGSINIDEVLKTFAPAYLQAVPIFSSVKVNGQKLRELARKYERFDITDDATMQKIDFYDEKELKKTIEVAKKEVKIYDIDLLDKLEYSVEEIKNIFNANAFFSDANLAHNEAFLEKIPDGELFKSMKISVHCSKGTYIRQLAYDVSHRLGTSGMLINLRRTSIGEISMSNNK